MSKQLRVTTMWEATQMVEVEDDFIPSGKLGDWVQQINPSPLELELVDWKFHRDLDVGGRGK
jgi:hypothetical protein